MGTKILSVLEFHSDQTHGRDDAKEAPVLITEAGQPSHVLLTFEEFKKVAPMEAERMAEEARHPVPETFRSIADALAMPGGEDIEFEPERERELARGWDFQ